MIDAVALTQLPGCDLDGSHIGSPNGNTTPRCQSLQAAFGRFFNAQRPMTLHHDVKKILEHLETIMADLTRLTAAADAISAKIDALASKPAPVPPVDDQPAINALADHLEAIAAKIPA